MRRPSRKRRGRIVDHGCAALVWPARARCFGARKDGETWSYRSSRPEFVPTCQRRWSTPRRTENGGYSFRVIPPAETSSTVPEISSTGSVKCRSFRSEEHTSELQSL